MFTRSEIKKEVQLVLSNLACKVRGPKNVRGRRGSAVSGQETTDGREALSSVSTDPLDVFAI